jgi:hypothetical protein
MENKHEEINKIKELLKENLALNKEMKRMIVKINRYVMFRRILGFIKIFFIVLVIFAAFIWLPPFLQDFVGKLNEIYSKVISLGN